MIEYHDPEAKVGIESLPYELSLNMTSGDPIRLGLLANGFPDSEAFLEALGAALQAESGQFEVISWNKGNASIPAGEAMLEEIRSDCHAVVAAYGH